jgi:hypothetical protein
VGTDSSPWAQNDNSNARIPVISAARKQGAILLAFSFFLLPFYFLLLTFYFFRGPACRVTAADGLTRPTPRLTPSSVIPAGRQRGSIRLPFPFSLLTFHFLKRDPGWQKVFHVQHATCSPLILVISDNGVQVFTYNLEAIFRNVVA